jgi:hypothetical protein
MGSAMGKRSRAAGFVVAAVVVGVLLGVVAVAPAMAADLDTTSLTARAGASTVTYGGGTVISAVLMDTTEDMAVGGEYVRVEQSASNTGPWSLLYIVTTNAGAYYTGTYAASVVPPQTTYYRFVYPGPGVFPGAGTYAAATSNVLKVGVKPVLGKPSCPSRIEQNHWFTLKGTVRPGASGGPAVTITAYRYRGKKWVSYATYSAKVVGTRYSHRIKIRSEGRFKFRASTRTSAQFVGVKSNYSGVLST